MSQPDNAKRKEESEGILIPVLGEIIGVVLEGAVEIIEPIIEVGGEIIGALLE